MCRASRTAAAALGVAVLLGGIAVPLVGLVLAEEPGPFCCGRGRCCCAGEAARGPDERDCVRLACGCGHGDATVSGAPLPLEAVLPAASLPAGPSSHRGQGTTAPAALLDRPHAPPLPPPRRSLPA